MVFHIEERRAWVRSHTHTIVFDRDPEFSRFAQDPSGKIKLMLRVWLADDRSGTLRDYLGTVTFCATGPSMRDLRRLFRFTSASARKGEAPTDILGRTLKNLLRDYIQKEYGPSKAGYGED